MKDLQRERLRHMMASAILELWKKETGSVSSVLIQGTICITSSTGRITVVQVADKYGGTMLEENTIGFHNSNSQLMMEHSSISPWKKMNHISQRTLTDIFNNNKHSLVEDGSENEGDNLDNEIRFECDIQLEKDIEQDFDENHNSNSMASLNNVEDSTRKAVVKEHESRSRPTSPVTSPVSLVKRSRSVSGIFLKDQELSASNVINLSGISYKKDSDLALSSPSSYTAQVHDVIRHRLLPNNKLSALALASDSLDSPTTPNQLGLKRSESNDDMKLDENSPEVKKTRPSPPSQYNGGPLTLIAPNFTNGSPPFSYHPITTPTVSPSSSGFPSPYILTPSPYTLLNSPPGNKYPELIRLPHAMNGWSAISPPSMSSNKPRSSISSNGSSSELSPDQNDTKQKIYQCDFCSKSFLFKSKYHEHLPVHTNQRPFQCHLCSRTYKYKYDLSVHLRTHMGIPTKSTVCPFCNAKFDTNKILRAHISESHNDKVKIEDCPALITSPST